jgi:hypothetical protein
VEVRCLLHCGIMPPATTAAGRFDRFAKPTGIPSTIGRFFAQLRRRGDVSNRRILFAWLK